MPEANNATLLYHELGHVLAALTRRSNPAPDPPLKADQLAPGGLSVVVPDGDANNPLKVSPSTLTARLIDLESSGDLLLQPNRYAVKEDPPGQFSVVLNSANAVATTTSTGGAVKVTVQGTLAAGPQPGVKVWALVKKQGEAQQSQPIERQVVAVGGGNTKAEIAVSGLTLGDKYDVLVLVEGYQPLMQFIKVS